MATTNFLFWISKALLRYAFPEYSQIKQRYFFINRHRAKIFFFLFIYFNENKPCFLYCLYSDKNQENGASICCLGPKKC